MGNFFKTVICVLTALIVLAGAAFWGLAGLLPAVDIEDSLRPDAASQYFDDKGELIYTTASEERRIPVSLDKMPKHLQEAFISIEDARFYEHGGIDIRGTARALVVTLTGGDVQGGSTITQQLAKNAFLTNERTITRKIKEAFIARQLEERYTKDEILNMYLNRIYFGQGTYGVECASLYYFGKHVEDIDLAEAATLAAIPKSPNYYNPLENPKASKERQELVLDQMVKYGYITQAQADALDLSLIVRFANSPLAGRILSARQVLREQPFVVRIPARLISPEYPSDETTLLQGILDLAFEEEDGWVLVDYKTDRIPPEGPQALALRYQGQLYAYRLALSHLTGRPVKQALLVLLRTGESIEIAADD